MTKGDLNEKGDTCKALVCYRISLPKLILFKVFLKYGTFFPEHHIKVAKVFEFTKALLIS